ncbi:MAG TPA: TonB-dependent receptor, partial [Arenimonas sp.]|nr:TonB-dependent receptor [Arenimonas sp.]
MPNTIFRKRNLTVAIAAAVFAPTLFAQEAAKTDSAGVLDTIQVTADRRSENIQDVPMSISTVSGEQLQAIRSGGEDVRVLSARIPSLYIESSFGRTFPRFYIRGLGNSDFDLNASQPVSLILDDVVQENPMLKGFPMFDIEQVEVFRGPQGTMFGRNTPAGVVKFSSVKPSDEVSGYGVISLGSNETVNLEGAIGGKLGDGWSARLSALSQHRGDFVDNTYTGEKDALEGYDDRAIRGQLMYTSDKFNALFNVHGRDLEGTARLFRANMIELGTNNPVAGFDRDKVSIDGVNEQNLSQFGASANLRWNFDQLSLISITGYESVDSFSRGDIDGGYGAVFLPSSGPGFIPFAAESADGLPTHSQFTQEFRLESNLDGKFEWQSGLYYFYEDIAIESFNYDTLFTQQQNGYATQTQENIAWAIYASGEYDLTEAFKMRAGLRYTQDSKDFVAKRLQAPPFTPPTLGQVTEETDESHTSWDISGIYTVNENVNLYARVAEGFRAPAIQGRLLFIPTPNLQDAVSVADTETTISYEMGLKSEFWDKRVRLGFNVYYFETEDQQLTAVGGTNNYASLINAEEVVGKGFELDLQAYLTDNLLLTLGASYNDTEINDPNREVKICGGGCTVLDPVGTLPDQVYIDGNPLPNAPKNIYNVTLRYGVPVGEGEFYAYTDWAYRSEVNFFLYDSVEFRGSSLLEGGLRVGYNWNNGNYEVAAYGR